MSCDNCFVYALVDAADPRSVRYVGKTTRGRVRLRDHLSCRGSGRCAAWVKRVLGDGGSVEMRVLEYCSPETATARERAWIAVFRDAGACLTNMTAGGEGLHGFRHSAEARAKMSAACKLRPKPTRETIEKVRLANLGRSHSMSTRLKMSEARKSMPRTEEWNRNISLAKRGHTVSADTRAKIAAKLRGTKASSACRANQAMSARRGESNHNAKLTEESVRAMRARLLAGDTQRAVASAFGVSQYLVSRLHRRLAWAHVD